MQTEDISFLQTKIASIGTALFFCDNRFMLPFTAYVVTALKTDDSGNVWFFISRTWNKTISYDVITPATLEFYRKGVNAKLHVAGKAELVNDPERTRGFMEELLGNSLPLSDEAISGVILVKVKIEQADYTEFFSRRPVYNRDGVTSLLKHWRSLIPHYHHRSLQPSV